MATVCFLCLFLAAGAARGAISFERNEGQTSREVQFLARAGNFHLFLTRQGAVLTFGGERPSGVRVSLLNAADDSTPTGIGPRLEHANYFMGSDRGRWLAGVPVYGRVLYRGIYRGVDLLYYDSGHGVEHDFIVSPGTDYHKIRMRVDGAAARLDSSGDLWMDTAAGSFRETHPEIYQEEGTRRVPVEGGFRLLGSEVSFEVGRYDHDRPLIIDPAFTYFSTYLGGSGDDRPVSIAVDGQGNSYVTGTTASLDFPVLGAAQSTRQGQTDLFVTKLDGNTGAVLYSTYLGGSGQEVVNQIRVDGSGNAYIAGTTYSPDFPVTKGAFQTVMKGPLGAFVAELNASGNGLVYATYLSGSTGSVGRGLAVDAQGSAFVVGITDSPDFPVKGTDFGSLRNGGTDGFVTKIAPGGAGLVYSGYVGGAGTDGLNGIAVNSFGEATLVGWTTSTDLPTTVEGSRWPVLSGGLDGLMVKLSPSGRTMEYISYYGGSEDDLLANVVADPREPQTAYMTGLTASADFPTASGPGLKVGADQAVPFVAKFELPGLIGPSSQAAGNARAAALPDDYSWYVPMPDDCKGTNWRPLLKQVDRDANALEKISNDVTNLAFDFMPNIAGITKDLLTLIKDVRESCPAANGGASASQARAADQTVFQPIFAVTADEGQSVDLPLFPVGTPGSFTSVSGIAAGPMASIYLAVETSDRGLPVSAAGVSHGAGTTTGYVMRYGLTVPDHVLTAVVNSGGLTAGKAVAPGSLVTLFGNFRGTATAQARTLPLPETLGGAVVSINGRAAPLYYVSETQINAQLPWETAAGQARATVSSGGVTTPALPFAVVGTSPGILVYGDNRAVAQNQDYSLNNADHPAGVGSAIVVYLTGGGAVEPGVSTGVATPNSPLFPVTGAKTATIGRQPAEVLFLGMTPGLVGVMQANLIVPPLDAGDYPVVISVGGVNSNAALVSVR
ncbi:MAG: SBBP repeat-containing protein [Bryobacterales bacterium]|nr:SBBP repeat-containing protein [Bryobacterales bacterium]